MKSHLMQVGAATMVVGFLVMPALAQTTNSGGTAMPASKDEVRASKLVGSTVYNDKNETVGTLDDILVTHDQKQPVQAVISVGGFLGIGSKLVEVPYDRLSLKENNKVVLPNGSRDELKNMQGFSYNTLDHSGTTNASSSSNSGASGSGMGTATGLGASPGTTTGSTGTGATGSNR